MPPHAPPRPSAGPAVQILTVTGCPSRDAAIALVERTLGVELQLELLEVADTEAAARLRVLGLPTIRIDGHAVEPGADQRSGLAPSCRIYRTTAGVRGQPQEAWVRDALLAQTGRAA